MFFLRELPTQRMMERYRGRFPRMDIDAVREALTMMRRASNLVRQLEAYFADHDLSLLRFLVLVVIDREPESEGLTHRELLDRIDVSKPVMTRTVQTLARDGLVRVECCTEDKRARRVSLTASGERRLNAALPGYFAAISEFMAAR